MSFVRSPRPASFRRIDADAPALRLTFEGEAIAALAGESVAAALLAAGVTVFRETAVGGQPRGPWCMMGVCFDCLVEIDGVANRQACMVPAADRLRVRRQLGARTL